MEEVQKKIQDTITKHPVLLYMKGNRLFPQCGFSKAVIDVLDTVGVKYETVDVLEDPEVREGIKHFSNWPTIPQLYVKGEFIGGCDIVREMYANGELEGVLKQGA